MLEKIQKPPTRFFLRGMSMGIAIGIMFGFALKNMPAGIAIGIAIGFAFGKALSKTSLPR